MPGLIDNLSALSTFVIGAACVVHLALFFALWTWSRRDLRTIASSLDDFTRGLNHRSILDTTSHLSDQIDEYANNLAPIYNHAWQNGDFQKIYGEYKQSH